MLNGTQIIINGDGEQERDFVYVEDCARANLFALTTANANTVYNLGFGRGTTVNEIYETLVPITGYKLQAKHGPAKLGETRRIFLDASKAGESLGWEASVDLTAGLQKTVEYFKRTEVPA
jgi:UDP-glucose 4-epimerase